MKTMTHDADEPYRATVVLPMAVNSFLVWMAVSLLMTTTLASGIAGCIAAFIAFNEIVSQIEYWDTHCRSRIKFWLATIFALCLAIVTSLVTYA